MAELVFEHGAMGARKTADLLVTAFDYEQHGSRVLVAKPLVDTKAGTNVESRIGISREVDFLIPPEMNVEAEVLRRKADAALEDTKRINAFLVDEAQFLQPGQVDQMFSLAVVRNIAVYAYGLRTDFQTNIFPGSQRLMEVSHEIKEVKAMCASGDGCESNAMFNARQLDGEYVAQGNQVAIDGEGKTTYKSLCGKHYLELVGPLPGLVQPVVELSA